MAPDSEARVPGLKREQAGVEVPRVHPHCALAGLAQRQRTGEISEHALPPECRQQADAGLNGARAVVVEDAAVEGRFAVAVQVVRALADRRLHRGVAPSHERPDCREQHVAAVDQDFERRRVRRVRRNDVEVSAESAGDLVQPGPGAPCQHRPPPPLHQCFSGQAAGEACCTEHDDPWHTK